MSVTTWLRNNWIGILIGIAIYYFLAAFAILAIILSVFGNKIVGFIAAGLIGGYIQSKTKRR